MRKFLLGGLLAFCSLAAFAAVDANKASQADLESVKGIGPALSTRILDERRKAPFRDWNDLIGRVKGVGNGSANRFSEAGLTVDGASFANSAPAVAAKRKH